VTQVLKVAHITLETELSCVIRMKKVVFIYARLVENPEAYEGKTNAEIEKEILEEIGSIPYVAEIEKVTVLDSPT